MLVLDAFRGHLTTGAEKVLRDGGVDFAIILGGMTSALQPLDVMLNKPFKDCVREMYNQWMADDNPKTPTGQLCKLLLATVATWVPQFWRLLPDDMVVRAFKICSISNSLDGTEVDMLWDAASDKQLSSDESLNSLNE